MTTPLLQVSDIVKAYGRHRAVDRVSFEAARGEVVCVMGPSGCGKSTLLRCINFLERPDDGFVRIGGDFIGRIPDAGGFRLQSERDLNRMRPRIGIVFQDFQLWPHLTLLQNLTRAPLKVLRRNPDETAQQALELLRRFDLAGKAQSYPSQLSGGQAQRGAIARALAMQPDVMLFDEPTSALDPELTGEALAVLREIAKSGMTMIVVTHEMAFAGRVADNILFMENGRIGEAGSPDKLLGSPSTPALRRFLAAVLHDRRQPRLH